MSHGHYPGSPALGHSSPALSLASFENDSSASATRALASTDIPASLKLGPGVLQNSQGQAALQLCTSILCDIFGFGQLSLQR